MDYNLLFLNEQLNFRYYFVMNKTTLKIKFLFSYLAHIQKQKL